MQKGWLTACGLYLMLGLASAVWAADDSSMPDGPQNRLTGQALTEALRSGGYILYFRHGITDHSSYDTDRDNLHNCASQRLLSAEGREQMRAIGDIIRDLGVEVSSVLSSPYCRCIDTAMLAFGERVKKVNDLRHTVNADVTTAKQRAVVLRELLGTAPVMPGTNTVISGHTANLQEATGIWPKPEGVAIIFKPRGNSQFDYVATVRPAEWQPLLKAAQRRAP